MKRMTLDIVRYRVADLSGFYIKSKLKTMGLILVTDSELFTLVLLIISSLLHLSLSLKFTII